MANSPDPMISSLNIDCLREATAWQKVKNLEEVAETVVATILANRSFHAFNFHFLPGSEVSLVFTDDAGIEQINAAHRGLNKPTNVLSFPQMPEGTKVYGPLLGDIIFGYETIETEAILDKKPFLHHLMHLIVHGFLHLVGFDHANDEQADVMETLETKILMDLNVPDPYGTEPK